MSGAARARERTIAPDLGLPCDVEPPVDWGRLGCQASTEALLDERQKTHGSYAAHARITQELKRVLQAGYPLAGKSDEHREALDMILHKIGRIVAGNANFQDHWDDIAGYAKLASKACLPQR